MTTFMFHAKPIPGFATYIWVHADECPNDTHYSSPSEIGLFHCHGAIKLSSKHPSTQIIPSLLRLAVGKAQKQGAQVRHADPSRIPRPLPISLCGRLRIAVA